MKTTWRLRRRGEKISGAKVSRKCFSMPTPSTKRWPNIRRFLLPTDDTDALVKSGMLLFNIGAMSNDKAKYQEAANFLQQFVDKAPDTDKLKADAKAILEELKNQQNVKAEKTTTTPARRRSRP